MTMSILKQQYPTFRAVRAEFTRFAGETACEESLAAIKNALQKPAQWLLQNANINREDVIRNRNELHHGHLDQQEGVRNVGKVPWDLLPCAAGEARWSYPCSHQFTHKQQPLGPDLLCKCIKALTGSLVTVLIKASQHDMGALAH